MPRTLSVQTYLDPCMMADIVREFEDRGIPHGSSYSRVLWTIIEQAHQEWSCAVYGSTEEALAMLEERGFSVAQLKRPRSGRRLLRNMNLEALGQETVDVERAKRAREIQQAFNEEEDKP